MILKFQKKVHFGNLHTTLGGSEKRFDAG